MWAPLEAQTSGMALEGPIFIGEKAMANELVELKATARERVGKGAARQARRDGRIPGVIYGGSKPPTPISLDHRELLALVKKGHFTSTVVEINVAGKKEKVIPRDVQLDPVVDTLVHIDLLRIGADGIIRVAVPVRFLNEELSPGLKRGGALNIVRHDIEVFCPYDSKPKFFEVDLEGLEIGSSIHVSSVKMPDGIKPVIHDRDFTIATIASAVKQEVEEEEEEVTAEVTDEAAADGADKPDGEDAGKEDAASADNKK